MSIQFDNHEVCVDVLPFARYVLHENGVYSVPGEEPFVHKSKAIQKICDELSDHIRECQVTYAELIRYKNTLAQLEKLESQSNA